MRLASHQLPCTLMGPDPPNLIPIATPFPPPSCLPSKNQVPHSHQREQKFRWSLELAKAISQPQKPQLPSTCAGRGHPLQRPHPLAWGALGQWSSILFIAATPQLRLCCLIGVPASRLTLGQPQGGPNSFCQSL